MCQSTTYGYWRSNKSNSFQDGGCFFNFIIIATVFMVLEWNFLGNVKAWTK